MKALISFVSMALLLPTLLMAAGPDKSGANIPTFVTGDNLGYIQPARDLDATKSVDRELIGVSALNMMSDFAVANLQAAGDEEFAIKKVWTDELGKTHVRLDQSINGLRVVGAQMIVHADSATGRVEAINGFFAPNRDVAVPNKVAKMPPTHRDSLAKLGIEGSIAGHPELLYFFDADTGVTHLAWEIRVVGEHKGGPFDNLVYLDARTLKQVGFDPQFHTAKSWRTHDAENNVYYSTFLPGTLLCDGNQSCGDTQGDEAHDGASGVYDYYATKFGRDSLNDNGMTLISSVHVGSNWNNAAFYNNQMVYGDGDGVNFSPLSGSYDVIAHELTHGVDSFEADLLYEKESGALSEGWADILGASAEAHRDGNVSANTWKLGEDVTSPGVPGDALRYMDNPAQDGYSADYYPERLYAGRCRPSNNNDACGVHGNSGIANLAYYLLVEGGTHPRGKTSEVVTGIGINSAEQIFYRALTTYLTTSSNFDAARTACASSAADLYDQATVDAVNSAWCAVGVGSCDGGNGGCSSLGSSCTANSECCSNKCKGPSGGKTCK